MPKKPNKNLQVNEIIEEEQEFEFDEADEGSENGSEPDGGYQNKEAEYNYDNIDLEGRLLNIIVDERVARRLHEEGIEKSDPQYDILKKAYEKDYVKISDNGEDKLFNVVMSFRNDDILLFCNQMEKFSGTETGNFKFFEDVDALASMGDNNMIDEISKVDKAFGDMFSPKRYSMLNLKLEGVKSSGEFEDPDFKAAEDLNRGINLGRFFDEEKDPPEREMMIESLVAGCLFREDVLGEIAPRTFSSLENIKGAELVPKGNTNLEKMLDPLFNNTIGEDKRRNANMPRLAVPKARKMAETILLGLENGSEEGKIALVEALENVVRVAGKYAHNCTGNDHRLFASSKLVYGAMQLLEQPAYRTYSTLSKKEIELARSVCASYECQKGMVDCHNDIQKDLMLKYVKNDGVFTISVAEDGGTGKESIVEANKSKIQKLNSYRHILEGQVQYSQNHSGNERRITDNEYLCALDSEEYSNLLAEKQGVNNNVKSLINTTDVQSFVNGYNEYNNKKYPKVETIHYNAASFNERFNRVCGMMNMVMTQVYDISPISDYYSELAKLNETVTKINKSDYEKIETLTRQRTLLAHFANRVQVNAKGDSYSSRFAQDLIKAHVNRATNAGQIKKENRPKGYVYSTADLPRFLRQDVEREIEIARGFANEATSLISELDNIISVREDEKKVVNSVIVRDKLTKHITSGGSTGIDKMQNFAANSGMNLSRSTLALREKVFVKNKVRSKFPENYDIINVQLRKEFETASVGSKATSKLSRVSGISSVSRISTISKMKADYENATKFYSSGENIQKAMEYNPEMNKGKFYMANKGLLKTVTLPEISKIKSLDKVNKKPNLDWGGKYSTLESRQSVLDKISKKKELVDITPPEFRTSQADISIIENKVRDHFYNSDLTKAKEAYENQIKQIRKDKGADAEVKKDDFDFYEQDSSNPRDYVTGAFTKYLKADINYAIELNKAISATGKGNIDFIIQDGAAALESLEKLMTDMQMPSKPNDEISIKNQEEFIKFVRKGNGPSNELVSIVLLQNLNKKREEYKKSIKYDNGDPNAWLDSFKVDEEIANAYNKADEIAKMPDYEAFRDIFEPQDLIKQNRLTSKRLEVGSKLKKYQKLFEDTAGLFPKEQMEVANKARNACQDKSRDVQYGNTSQKGKIFFTRTVIREDETKTTYKVKEKRVNGGFVSIVSTLEMYKKQLKSKVLNDTLWKNNYTANNYQDTYESLLERYEGGTWDQDDEEMAYDFMLEKFDLNMDDVNKYLNENVNEKGEPVPKTGTPKDQTRFELLRAQRKSIEKSIERRIAEEKAKERADKIEAQRKKVSELTTQFENREKTNADAFIKKFRNKLEKHEERRIQQLKEEQERLEQERIEKENQLRKAQEDKAKWDKEREEDLNKYFSKAPVENERAEEIQENNDLDNEEVEENLDDILDINGNQNIRAADVEISDTSTEIRKNLAPELTYLKGMKFKSQNLKDIVFQLDLLNTTTDAIYYSANKKVRLDKEDITEFAKLNEDALKEIEKFLGKKEYTEEEAPEVDRMLKIMSYLKSDIELINQFEINDVKSFNIDELVEDARERNRFALDTKDVTLKAIENEGSLRIPIRYVDEHNIAQEGYVFPIAGNMNPQNANKRIFNDNLFFYKMGASESQKNNIKTILDSGYQSFTSIFDENGNINNKQAASVLAAKGIDVDSDFNWKEFSAEVRKIRSDIEYQAELSKRYYRESGNALSRGRNLAYNTVARGFGVGESVPVSRILKIKNGNEEMNVGFEHRLYSGAHHDLSSEVTAKWASSSVPKVTKAFLLKAIDMDAYNYIVGFKPDYNNMKYKFVKDSDGTPHLDGIMMQKTDGSFVTDIDVNDFKKMPYITRGMADIIKAYTPEKLRQELKFFELGDKEITSAIERLETAKQVVEDAEKGEIGSPTIITKENAARLDISDLNLVEKSNILTEVSNTCSPSFVKDHAKKTEDGSEYTELSDTKEIWFGNKDTYLNPLENLKCELDKADSFFHINSGLYKKMYASLNAAIRSIGISNSTKETSFKLQYQDLITKCGDYVKERGKSLPSSQMGKDRLAAAIKIGKFAERRLEIVNLKETRTALAEKFIVMSNKGKTVDSPDYIAVGGTKFDKKVTQILLNPSFEEMVRGKSSKELKDMLKKNDNELVGMLKQASKQVDIKEKEKNKEVKTLKSVQNGLVR